MDIINIALIIKGEMKVANTMEFKTESNGYSKEQVDQYIQTIAVAYRDLTNAYNTLHTDLEEAKKNQSDAGELSAETQQIKEENLKLTTQISNIQREHNSRMMEKDTLIRMLEAEKRSLEANIAQLEQKKSAEGKGYGDYTDLIANVMVDAEVFATELKQRAQKEASVMQMQAKQELQQLEIVKETAYNDLKKLQAAIEKVIHSTGFSELNAIGDGK